MYSLVLVGDVGCVGGGGRGGANTSIESIPVVSDFSSFFETGGFHSNWEGGEGRSSSCFV